jgi:hypothetical protein
MERMGLRMEVKGRLERVSRLWRREIRISSRLRRKRLSR